MGVWVWVIMRVHNHKLSICIRVVHTTHTHTHTHMQVRSTGRRDFIRDGQDEGELVVTITNEGQDAYKPEEYGKTIKITRTLKKSGTNTWKTSNGQTGKTIKTKASEVQMIAEHFNFQVCCVGTAPCRRLWP